MKFKLLITIAVLALTVGLTACNKTPADDTTPPADGSNAAVTAAVSIDDAKATALKHAGVEEASLNYIDIDVLTKGESTVYDVEFRCEGTEYDYQIDGTSGEVLSYESDRNNMNIETARQDAGETITVEEAQNKALESVDLTLDGIEYLDVDFDSDDGKAVYSVEFRHAETDFEIEIDAVSGEILSTEKEPVGD